MPTPKETIEKKVEEGFEWLLIGIHSKIGEAESEKYSSPSAIMFALDLSERGHALEKRFLGVVREYVEFMTLKQKEPEVAHQLPLVPTEARKHDEPERDDVLEKIEIELGAELDRFNLDSLLYSHVDRWKNGCVYIVVGSENHPPCQKDWTVTREADRVLATLRGLEDGANVDAVRAALCGLEHATCDTDHLHQIEPEDEAEPFDDIPRDDEADQLEERIVGELVRLNVGALGLHVAVRRSGEEFRASIEIGGEVFDVGAGAAAEALKGLADEIGDSATIDALRQLSEPQAQPQTCYQRPHRKLELDIDRELDRVGARELRLVTTAIVDGTLNAVFSLGAEEITISAIQATTVLRMLSGGVGAEEAWRALCDRLSIGSVSSEPLHPSNIEADIISELDRIGATEIRLTDISTEDSVVYAELACRDLTITTLTADEVVIALGTIPGGAGTGAAWETLRRVSASKVAPPGDVYSTIVGELSRLGVQAIKCEEIPGDTKGTIELTWESPDGVLRIPTTRGQEVVVALRELAPYSGHAPVWGAIKRALGLVDEAPAKKRGRPKKAQSEPDNNDVVVGA